MNRRVRPAPRIGAEIYVTTSHYEVELEDVRRELEDSKSTNKWTAVATLVTGVLGAAAVVIAAIIAQDGSGSSQPQESPISMCIIEWDRARDFAEEHPGIKLPEIEAAKEDTCGVYQLIEQTPIAPPQPNP